MPITASPTEQRRLLDLQAADTLIRQLEHRAKTLADDAEIAALDDQLVALDRTVLERLGVVDDLTTEIGRVEADVRTVEARQQRDRDRLQTVSDPKTATAIEHEVASLEKRRSDLEDIELEVMERLEAAEADLQVAREEAEKTRSTRQRLDAARDDGIARIKVDLDAAVADRASIASGIAADLLALYERQRERYGLGASLLSRGTSSASGVELTAAELAEVRNAAADAVLLCPSSSAILVRTDESGI